MVFFRLNVRLGTRLSAMGLTSSLCLVVLFLSGTYRLYSQTTQGSVSAKPRIRWAQLSLAWRSK